jgi:two-component system sensor histidine kinase BaeS
MTLQLWQKLAVAMVMMSMIIVAIASLLSMQSFTNGFLGYLNELEKPKIDRIKTRLIRGYQRHGNWDFIAFSPHVWRDYVRAGGAHKRPRRNRRGHQAPPEKGFWQDDRPPFNEEGGRRRPPPEAGFHRENGGRRGDKPPPPPKLLQQMALREAETKGGDSNGPEHLALLDTDLNIIAGEIKINNPAYNYPLILNQQRIAYLHVEPFIKLTSDLDQRFIKKQWEAVIKIALLALALSLIGAWGFAYYLRNRLRPLTTIANDFTEHDYSARVRVKQTDELGQLAQDLNILGRTLEKNQTARQQWIADISHELRTPLSILSGELEAIEDGIRPLSQQSMTSLNDEARRLKKLVDDLFQLSLSDLGALQYSWSTIDLLELMTDVATNFEVRFSEKSLVLSNACIEQGCYFVKGDRNRLYQLFSNIFENSYRYTNEKGKIQFNCQRQNNRIQLSIADSAPSVPENQLEKMFDRLHRVEKSRNRKTGGAGLGLTIVKTIVEAHDGTIVAKPSSLGGVEIIIEFPLNFIDN